MTDDRVPAGPPRPLRALLASVGSVLPLAALIVWAASATMGSAAVATIGSDGVPEIAVRAHTWGFSPRVVRVDPGDTVRFVVVSDDIKHGFAINELGVNLQLAAGKAVRSPAVRVDLPPGVYPIHCSVFCGMGHPSMKGRLVVGDPGRPPASALPGIASLLTLAAAGLVLRLAAGGRVR